jgi:hypothetical protein
MLSLKKKPIIRYEKMSAMARKLAVELQVRVICVLHRTFGFNFVIEPHPGRVPTVRLQTNSGSAAPPHP